MDDEMVEMALFCFFKPSPAALAASSSWKPARLFKWGTAFPTESNRVNHSLYLVNFLSFFLSLIFFISV